MHHCDDQINYYPSMQLKGLDITVEVLYIILEKRNLNNQQSSTSLSCQTTTYIREEISSTTPLYTPAGTLTPSISAGHHNGKYPIKLPGSEAEWMEADKHFLVYLLPAVQLAGCVEDKYKILADGIFNFFSSQYGCHHRRKEKNNSEPSRRPKHDRALKKIKQLKTKAPRDFHHAKRTVLWWIICKL